MIGVLLEREEVGRMQAEGSLRKFLSDLRIPRVGTGEIAQFMMDLPIEQMPIEGEKGEAVAFYQEEIGDYQEGDYDTGNIREF